MSQMKWSLRLGSISGIDILMHWTFLILIAWIALSGYYATHDWGSALQGVIFVLAIFGCVVLHELGHVLMARRYGIRTKNIVLLPIGGVSNLERMPEEPAHELAVAFAGPAVNVVIAGILYLILAAGHHLEPLERFTFIGGSFLYNLMVVNIALVVFNLLPAFPMDGGRVLRALLATRMDYVKATQTAAGVGQAMAIVFGFLGLFSNPFLLLIALFVYLGAEGEAQMVSARSAFRNVPVREAMITRFRALTEDDTLEQAVQELLAGTQHDFPVVRDGQIVGVLPRATLLKALAEGGQNRRVGDVMERECSVAAVNDGLDQTFQRMKEEGCSTVPVLQDGRLVGLLSMENIGEWAMVQSALHHEGAPKRMEPVVGA